MKKLLLPALVIIFTTILFSGCEKDDICPEGTATTPRLIIDFFENDNQILAKNVSNFQVFAPGRDTIAIAGPVSRIELPLITDGETTQWGLILSSPVTGGYTYNTDFITFNYTTRDIYVSRACGFKSVFTLYPEDAEAPGTVLTDNAPADNLWIRSTAVVNPNIENEDEAHLHIYF